jgi:replicative DNA helicase
MPRRAVDPVIPGRYVGALDVHTEIPVPGGMTTLEHLEAGDSVFGSGGCPATIAEISEPLTDLPCFEVEFATGDRIVADEEQRWLTERRDVPRSAAVPSRRATLEVAGSVVELGPAALGVRVAPAIQLPTKRVPVDPYVLGAWLAAGVENGPGLIGAGNDLVRKLRDLGVRVFTSGLPDQHWIAVPVGARRGADLASRLRDLNVLGDKHLPMLYLRAGEDQRRALLAGLLDAGGTVSDGGEVLFRAANHGLAAGVHQLIASLGYRPWLRPGRGRGIDVGFVTGEQVFGLGELHALQQGRRRLGADIRPRRLVVRVRRVAPRPLRRLRIASDDGLLLVGRSFIPVPGATLEPFEQISSPA